MDNLTHSLVGLTAAKAGLERLSPGATAVCVLAANSPDCDVAILLFGDRWTYLHHHRGITHAIVGVAFLSLFLPLVFYGIDRLWARFRGQPAKTRLKGLIVASVLVTATHPLLDWTNNYGIRFFLPWSSKWSYGDLVYIIDPYIWLLLGGACFLLSAKTMGGKIIWGAVAAVLTGLVIFAPRAAGLPFFFVQFWVAAIVILIVLFVLGAGRRFGNKIAIVALAIVPCYWTFLAYAHSRALANGYYQATNVVQPSGEPIRRLSVTYERLLRCKVRWKSKRPDRRAVSGETKDQGRESTIVVLLPQLDTPDSDPNAHRSPPVPAEIHNRQRITKATVWFLRTT